MTTHQSLVQVLKCCETEQQRQEYLLAISLVAPPRSEERSNDGYIRRIASRLCVSRDKRSIKRGGRPYAFNAAVDRRAIFDVAAARYSYLSGPLRNGQQRSLVPDAIQVGEKVLTHNGPAELTRFTPDGGCVVIYRVGDAFAERIYAKCYSKEAGSARLRRPPPSLTPPSRVEKSGVSDTEKKQVLDHLQTIAPTSSSQRDVMRRQVGPFCFEEKNAFILSDTQVSIA